LSICRFGFCTAFLQNMLWNGLQRNYDADRHDNKVVQVTDDRDEIRNKIYGTGVRLILPYEYHDS
jgi:hypothetical protein